MSQNTPKYPTYRKSFYLRRWLLWIAGSLLVAVVSLFVEYWLRGNDSSPQKGIHVRAFGIFSASNEVRIHDNVNHQEQRYIDMEARGITASNEIEVTP